MFGKFNGERFDMQYTAEIDKGPDQYAGQVFQDHLGRNLLISWIPGWEYSGYASKDVGCFSVPREIKLIDGEITAYPVEELQFLLTDEDPALERTETGFIIKRTGRNPVVYKGEITDLKIIRDGYIIEVFVNGGKEIYSALL
jgi:sucrose-6-phosphate hydrolase SacC (GH32 family)